jgi:hypothetical protein
MADLLNSFTVRVSLCWVVVLKMLLPAMRHLCQHQHHFSVIQGNATIYF